MEKKPSSFTEKGFSLILQMVSAGSVRLYSSNKTNTLVSSWMGSHLNYSFQSSVTNRGPRTVINDLVILSQLENSTRSDAKFRSYCQAQGAAVYSDVRASTAAKSHAALLKRLHVASILFHGCQELKRENEFHVHERID